MLNLSHFGATLVAGLTPPDQQLFGFGELVKWLCRSTATAMQVISQRHRVPAVTILLGTCCPTAVLRAVRPVIVNPVNRMLGAWLWPHVGEKKREAVSCGPSRTDGYAPPAIVRVGPMFGIRASRPQLRPGVVFRGCFALGARAMSAAIVAIGKMLFYQASATLPTTGQQEPRQNPDSLAAITQAKPLSGRTASVLFPEQYGEPAESHSLEIRLSSNSFKPVADDRFRAVRRTFRSHALIVPLSWVSEL